MLVQKWSHMLALVRRSSFAPVPLQCSYGKDLGIQTSRIGTRKQVARVVAMLFLKNPDRSIYQFWIDQRAVGRDAHHGTGGIGLRGLVVAIEHVILRAAKPRDAKTLALPNESNVGVGTCGRNHDFVNELGAAQAPYDAGKDRIAPQIHDYRAGQTRATHPGLANGNV